MLQFGKREEIALDVSDSLPCYASSKLLRKPHHRETGEDLFPLQASQHMSESADPVPLWFDCDPGHDDAMAIILATHNPKIHLLGLSAVAGNQTVEKTYLNILKMLAACGIEKGRYPVVKGAAVPLVRPGLVCPEIHGESGLDSSTSRQETSVEVVAGEETDVWASLEYSLDEEDESQSEEIPVSAAANFLVIMYETIMKYFVSTGKQVTFACTGCCTNLALLLRVFPNVKRAISHIALMAGAIGLGNTSPKAEFNVELDPEATAIVFSSGIRVTTVVIELTHKVLCTSAILDRILETLNHSRFGKMIVDLLLFFGETYERVFGFKNGPPLHDPTVIAYLIGPEMYVTKEVFIGIERKSEFCDGATIVDIHGRLGRDPNATVCLEVNVDWFWDLMIGAFVVANEKSPMNLSIKRPLQMSVGDEKMHQAKRRKLE